MANAARITVDGFVRRFKQRDEQRPDRPFCFVLGAGASRPSGIRTGAEMVREWLRDLHQERDASGLALETWATAASLRIDGFELGRVTDFYGDLFDQRFPLREDGFAFLEHEMKDKAPSYGYSVLAHLLSTTLHRIVITTNFDNLVRHVSPKRPE